MRNIKEFLDAWFAAKPTKEARIKRETNHD